MTEIRLDRASVGALVARAAILFAHLREREPFHARVLAERLSSSWLAPSMSLDDLVASDEGPLHDAEHARIRALLLARVEALRARPPADLPARPALVDLLSCERARAERARDELAASLRRCACEGDESYVGCARFVLLQLAGLLTSMLELRILAERAGDPERAERIDAERDRWIALARSLVTRAPPVVNDETTRLRPLTGRVVLSVARAPAALGRLAAMLEDAGATTVLASSCRAALSLARWFHVDAALCMIEGPDDPLLALAESGRNACAPGVAAPLFVALLPPRASVQLELASASGFDAAIPIDLADPSGLWITLGIGIQARRRTGSARASVRRARTRPSASV